MANVEPKTQTSSPSGNRTSARSQAGNPKFTQDDIKDDVAQDLNSRVKCKFDDLLKHFLYRILEDNSDQKNELDSLQERIESLQSKRYYSEGNGGDGDTTLDDPPAPVAGGSEGRTTATMLHESARQEESSDDSLNGTEEEQRLITRRDTILERLLREALDVILPVANAPDLLKLLNTFAQSFGKGQESNRYTPYVQLCNDVLDRLRNATGDLPVRKNVDELDIRFQCSDPATIHSRLQGTTTDIERKPDIIISSSAALVYAHKMKTKKDIDFAQTPGTGFKLDWPVVLSCHEFKVNKARIPASGKGISKRRFENDTILEEQTHEKLLETDKLTGEDGTDQPSSLKRTLDAGEGDRLSKKAKKTPDGTPGGTPSGSRAESAAGSASKPEPMEQQTKKAALGRVQCASYALEMLSYSVGVHHAINILYTDDILWLWYYDRQGIIQSTGISIFRDFPRFLVLLLAFQRFTQEDWGIISALNPKAVNGHKRDASTIDSKDKGRGEDNESNPPVVVDLNEDISMVKHLSDCWNGDIVLHSKVQLDMKFLSPEPHCLAGRATAVVPATASTEDGTTTDMVCKVYNPEIQRRHEGLTMQVIYQIAKDSEIAGQGQGRSMLDHLPKLYFYGDVAGSTTHRIRSMVKRRWKGHRILRIIGMKRLQKVTTVSGWEFVKAWLDGVTCHAFLWKNFVEHGDPSASNLMYDPEVKCGVLTDFDLSLLQWEPRIFGTDRTGTVPFMALDLLSDDYWAGRSKRYYHHELESFIWILPYVFLTYEGGKYKPNSLIDGWRTSNYIVCLKEKAAFNLRLSAAKSSVTSDFQKWWSLAERLCSKLQRCSLDRDESRREMGDILVLEQSDSLNRRDSEALWNVFCDTVGIALRGVAPEQESLLTRLRSFQPTFELDDDKKNELRAKYKNVLYSGQTRPEDLLQGFGFWRSGMPA